MSLVEAIARALRKGRRCEGDVPCAFCHWPEDERTPEHDETGCIYLAERCLEAIEREGWRLAPKEPSLEMMEALWNAMFQERFSDQHVLIGAGYDAMLAAAKQG